MSKPSPTRALVLGLLSISGVIVVVTLPLGPLAWHQGAVALRAQARTGPFGSSSGEARAGMILGMIATGVMVLVVIVSILVGALYWAADSIDTGYPVG